MIKNSVDCKKQEQQSVVSNVILIDHPPRPSASVDFITHLYSTQHLHCHSFQDSLHKNAPTNMNVCVLKHRMWTEQRLVYTVYALLFTSIFFPYIQAGVTQAFTSPVINRNQYKKKPCHTRRTHNCFN